MVRNQTLVRVETLVRVVEAIKEAAAMEVEQKYVYNRNKNHMDHLGQSIYILYYLQQVPHCIHLYWMENHHPTNDMSMQERVD